MRALATMVSMVALMGSALLGCAGDVEGEDQAGAIADDSASATLAESTGTAQEACGYPVGGGFCGTPVRPPCLPPRPPCFPPRPRFFPPPFGWGRGLRGY